MTNALLWRVALSGMFFGQRLKLDLVAIGFALYLKGFILKSTGGSTCKSRRGYHRLFFTGLEAKDIVAEYFTSAERALLHKLVALIEALATYHMDYITGSFVFTVKG